MERYDVVVVGVGGMGSAALYHLARRGKRVLGVERFDIPTSSAPRTGSRGSSGSPTSSTPSYVPLVQRAYELWRELEREAGEQLLHVTGAVEGGPRIFEGALRSCHEHDLPHEALDGAEVGRRFPAYRLPPDLPLVYQPDGGFLAPERCIVAHVNGALAHGAVVRTGERVLEWEARESGVRVRTDRGDGRGGSPRSDRGCVVAGRRATAGRARHAAATGPGVARARSSPISSRPSGSRSSTSRWRRGTCTASRSTASPDSRSASTTMRASGRIPTRSRASRRPDDEVPVRRFVERYFPRGAGRRWT